MSAKHVLFEIYARVCRATPHIRIGREMKHYGDTFHRSGQFGAIQDVSLDDRYSADAYRVIEMASESCGEVVVHDDFVVLTYQFVNHMASDKSRASSNQSFHVTCIPFLPDR